MRVCVKCFAFLSALSLFFVCNVFAEALTSRDSVMNLFIHDYRESNFLDSLSDLEKYDPSEMVRQDIDDVRSLRISMMNALEHDDIDSLKKLVEAAEAFEKSSSTIVIHDGEKLLLKYFLGDFESLCNLDFVSHYNNWYEHIYGAFHQALYNKMHEELKSGKLEEKLESIENESDRNFAFVVLNGYFCNKEKTSALIEERKYKLKNRKQLEYLVDTYWRKDVLDSSRAASYSVGASYTVMLGNVSKKVDNAFGLYAGSGAIIDNYYLEFSINGHVGDNSVRDSLYFFNVGVEANFGYVFLNLKDTRFSGYLTTGVGVNTFSFKGDNSKEKKKSDWPTQVYPSFGGGFAFDFFPIGSFEKRAGLRFRAGVKNIFSGKTVHASGVRLYTSIEFVGSLGMHKSVKFDYPNTER